MDFIEEYSFPLRPRFGKGVRSDSRRRRENQENSSPFIHLRLSTVKIFRVSNKMRVISKCKCPLFEAGDLSGGCEATAARWHHSVLADGPKPMLIVSSRCS